MQERLTGFVRPLLRARLSVARMNWRKWLVVSAIAFWLLVLVLPAQLQAQAAIQATPFPAKVEYPQSLAFRVQAQSSSEITKLALRYRLDKLSCVSSIVNEAWPEFNPAAKVDTTWTWQMKKTGGLPPGAKLEYGWLVVDAKGQRQETPWTPASFDDSRFKWQSLSDGPLTLYWYEGDQRFAKSLLDAGTDALKRMAQDTGIKLERPVKIYIYASTDALQSARVFAPSWEGGVAFPEYGIVAIGVAQSQLDWGQKTVAHELTHVLNYHMTRNCYGDIPTWLSEGLSVYAEGELETSQQRRLQRAIADNKLFSVRTLSGPFPAQTDDALLSYAESYSIVKYLITKYGSGKMLDFLAAFKNGLTDDEALGAVYGLDKDRLDAQWRASVGAPPRTGAASPRPRSLAPASPASNLLTKRWPGREAAPLFGLATGAVSAGEWTRMGHV